ncbi:MAG: DUF499 domain-containing protein [Alphaproteobacteria bacterium]
MFEKARADTVANIADFNADGIDPARFFSENHPTEGMRVLFRQAFDRLSGRSDQGVFRLKQAMGGGKTHNLIALGLLAKHAGLRRTILAECGIEADDERIEVAAFDGRETDTREFLWLHILKLLNRQELWQGPPNEPPGASTWARVLGDQPTLIMLDEMPPFFVALGARPAGPGTMQADLLSIALANLMSAIMTNRLPRCCLVISDLSGVWAQGSAHIQQAIDNATSETNRTAMDITPVQMDGAELYGILRRRLFEEIRDREAIPPVSRAYAEAYRTAAQQAVIPPLFEGWATQIADTYPFHPGMQDLFARFRENPGFQQTRETLRLARRMVASVWEDKTRPHLLIHPHDIDFNDSNVGGMLDRINPSLRNACSRDVASRGRASAEALAEAAHDSAPADAAKLLYLSSLAMSTDPNALQGLTPEEVAGYLCAPSRDVSRVNMALLTQLEDAAWYLHRRTDGRWYYRDVKNVNSAIKDRASIIMVNPDAPRKEVEAYLRQVFKPGRAAERPGGIGRPAYQRLAVFPTTEDIQKEMSADDVLLVISQPHSQGLHPELRQLWQNQTFKNRLMFLCGEETFTRVAENAAYTKAAEDQIAEFQAQRMPDTAPEMQQAKTALDRWRNGLLSALRETFTQLYYPGLDGTLTRRTLKLEFSSNAFVGEAAILDTLRDERKYREDVETDAFRSEFEDLIFTAQTMQWRDLLEQVARRADWYLVPPGAHESLKSAAFLKVFWRDEGAGYLRKRPFPPERTAVVLQQLVRSDETGQVTLQVSAKNGDRVHYEEDARPVTTASPVVQNGRLETDAMKITFLAVDSTGVHETGDSRSWQNTITLKYQVNYRDGAHRVTLKAIPRGTIRYSIDGSNPRYGEVYEEEIPIEEGWHKPIAAIAEAAGIWSDPVPIAIPRGGGRDKPLQIDQQRPAEWRCRLKGSDRRRSFEVLAILKRFAAEIGGAQIDVSKPDDTEDWISLSFGQSTLRTAEFIEARASELAAEFREQPDLRIAISRLKFPSGRALIEAAKELGVDPQPDGIVQ